MNKRGISIIIGYVLLVVIAISLSLLVYAWLRGYLPGKTKGCSESTALGIENYICNVAGPGELNLSLKNRGFFNLDGFIIYISNNTGDLPTKSLTKISGPIVKARGQIGFDFAEQLKPGQTSLNNVLDYSSHTQIVEVQIIPFIYEGGEQVLCDNAVIVQELEGCVVV